MNWSFINKWIEVIKKVWQSFIDSLGTPVTPIKPPVTDAEECQHVWVIFSQWNPDRHCSKCRILWPSPAPDPPIIPPPPVPIPEPPPIHTGVIVVADLDTIPERMRQAGFSGRDGALYYALAVIYGGGNNSSPPSDGETWILFQRRDEICTWWTREIEKVAVQLRANPGLTAKIIENDGRIDGAERLGCRLVGPTMERLAGFGNRIQAGDVFPEEGY